MDFKYVAYASPDKNDPFNLRLIVNVGSVDDEQRGTAHIVEHMVFRANRAHPVDIHHFLDDIGWKSGLQINAKTRQTETQFMIRTRPNDTLSLSESVKLLSDLAFGAKITDEQWQIERNVILEEMRAQGSIAERVNELKKKVVRNGSRYTDRPTIGLRKDINAIKVSDIRRFYSKFYVPGNMTLIASGHFDEAELVKAINHSFAKEENRPAPERDYRELPLKKGLYISQVQDPEGVTSMVAFGFRTALAPKNTEQGEYERLQNYFLRKLVRTSLNRATSLYDDTITSLHMKFSQPTDNRLVAALGVKTGNHNAGLAIILREIERLKQHGLDAQAFQALKKHAIGVVHNNQKAIAQRSFTQWEDKITAAVMQGGVEEDYQVKSARTLKWINDITLSSLNRRLKTLLSAEDQFLYYQIPGGETRTLPTVAEVKHQQQQISREPLSAFVDLKPAKTDVKVPVSQPEQVTIDFRERQQIDRSRFHKEVFQSQHITRWILDNGDAVIVWQRPTPDNKLYIKALSDAGFENSEQPAWLAQTALQIWQQADVKLATAEQLTHWQKQQQLQWHWAQQATTLDLSAIVTPDKLQPLMQVYAAQQTQWQLPDSAVNAVKEQLSRVVHNVSDQQKDQAALWGIPTDTQPSPPDIEQLSYKELTTAIKQLKQQPTSMLIVGDLSETDVERQILPYLASIERKSTFAPRLPKLHDGVTHLTQTIHKENKATVVIKGESPMPWRPEDSFLISALNPIMQKALKNKLRHELGGVYTVRFEAHLDRDNVIRTTTSFTTAPEKVDSMLKGHQQVLAHFSQQLARENYPRLRDDIRFAEQLRANDPGTALRRLALSFQRYQSPEYLDALPTLVNRVNEKELTSLAQRIFPPAKQATLVSLPQL